MNEVNLSVYTYLIETWTLVALSILMWALTGLSMFKMAIDGSSSGYKTAEAEMFGIRNFEETKDVVLTYVKGIKPVAVGAEAEFKPGRDMNEQILQELRRIRKAVEK